MISNRISKLVGPFEFSISNVNGCNSTVTLNLTIANNDSDVYVDACQSYFYNGQTYTTGGTFSHLFTYIFGCDSIVSLHLSVTIIDTTVSQTGAYLQSNFQQTGATYQCIDCNTGAWLSLAVNDNYVAAAPGSYGVIISYNNCVDTSECISVTNVGFDENDFQNNIRIYPNPTNGIFKIESSIAFTTGLVN